MFCHASAIHPTAEAGQALYGLSGAIPVKLVSWYPPKIVRLFLDYIILVNFVHVNKIIR